MRCGSSSTRLSTLQVPVKVPEVVAVADSVGVGLVTVGVGVARVPGAGTRLGPGKRLSPMASGSALPHRRDERSRQDRGMGLARTAHTGVGGTAPVRPFLGGCQVGAHNGTRRGVLPEFATGLTRARIPTQRR